MSMSILVSVVILSATALRVSQSLTTRAAAIPATQENPSAVNDRYDLREYKHGNIAGVMLIDKAIGRVWVYATDTSNGKEHESYFSEVNIEKLWQTPTADEFGADLRVWYEQNKNKPPVDKDKLAADSYETKEKVRQLTRPDAVLRAEAEARKKAPVSEKP
jgi:hypothetical protein